jgi:hypothetical protein
MTYYVAVHGGAGFHFIEDEKEVRKALRRYGYDKKFKTILGHLIDIPDPVQRH